MKKHPYEVACEIATYIASACQERQVEVIAWEGKVYLEIAGEFLRITPATEDEKALLRLYIEKGVGAVKIFETKKEDSHD